jgi:hypothetical protein
MYKHTRCQPYGDRTTDEERQVARGCLIFLGVLVVTLLVLLIPTLWFCSLFIQELF